MLLFPDCRMRVHMSRQERYVPCCIQNVNIFGVVSGMVCTAISHTGKTEVVFVHDNIDTETKS